MDNQLSYFMRLSSVLEAMPDALIIINSEGRIVLINRQTEKLFDYERTELLGESIEQLMPARFRKTHQKHRHGYFDTPRTRQMGEGFELYGMQKNGKEFPVEISLSPLKTEEGVFALAAVRDITLRQKAEKKFKSILEATPDCLVIINKEGKIILVNALAEKLFGYKQEEMLGQKIEFLIPNRYRVNHIDHRSNYFLKPRVRPMGMGLELFGLHKEGYEFPVEISLSPLETEEGQLALAAIRDISERKRLDEQLRKKNEELEEKNRRVQEANRLKSEFLANMSHELRTPLNGIIGFSELMHDEKVGQVSAEQKEYLGDILSSSKHLLQLINDVLDLAKVESGKIEFHSEKIDISKLTHEVRDILRTLIAEKCIDLKIKISKNLPQVILDPAKLKQILYNFLSNALKFTPDEGQITIEVKPEGQEKIRLEVRDTGIGILKENIPRLFVEFQQLDSSTGKKYQGTGLGLALTRRMVEAQGGQVGVKSVFNKGSTFYAILPCVQDPSISFHDIKENRMPAQTRPMILVIEDDENDRHFIVNAITKAGYSVETAVNGAEALRRLNEHRFDAITLDLLLPDLSGWDILRALRREGLNQNTPVIVVTIVTEKSISIDFGIKDFLTKPIKSKALLKVLEKNIDTQSDSTKSILVVDDNPKDLKLMADLLKSSGYTIICEQDPKIGLKLAKQIKPDAIILDLLMPGMSGFEFLTQLRQSKNGQKIPVLVWTAKNIDEMDRQNLEALTQGILLKSGGSIKPLLVEIQRYLN